MIWAQEAEAAIRQVPFFIRKKVKRRVEAFSADRGRTRVTLEDVQDLKKQFLDKGGMEQEIKGYEVSACFGGQGCPNAVGTGAADLARSIETLMEAADLLAFLKSRVRGGLKFHHEFRVSISDCPNACSRPQITSIGIVGAALPGITGETCSRCNACTTACPDGAVFLPPIPLTGDGPSINQGTCLVCGKCVQACPTGTLEVVSKGFRVFLGGRLGRHPRLGMEVPGILSHAEVLDLVQRCLDFYKTHSTGGKSFSHILESLSQVV